MNKFGILSTENVSVAETKSIDVLRLESKLASEAIDKLILEDGNKSLQIASAESAVIVMKLAKEMTDKDRKEEVLKPAMESLGVVYDEDKVDETIDRVEEVIAKELFLVTV